MQAGRAKGWSAALGIVALAAWAVAAAASTAVEEGIASWYGGKFHGRRTASGEVFDKGAMTAAHRTLPFGTQLRVTNLDNGRQARLTVNDRGPFVKDRVLDASEAGAQALGFHVAGTARVRLEILGALPNPDDARLSRRERKRLRRELERAEREGQPVPDAVLVPVDPDRGPFLVQAGAFSLSDNATRLSARLADLGFESRVVTLADGLHRVRVGPWPDRVRADEAARRLAELGHPTFIVRDDR